MSYYGNFGYPFLDRRLTPPAPPVHSIVTPPTGNGLAVSLDEVKEHLGYGDEVDAARDAELTAFILAAQAAIESFCDITILTTVVQADYESFQVNMPLVKRPYQSLGSIEYVATGDGTITEVDSGTYHVAAEHQKQARVYLGKGLEWPTDVADRKDAVRITYTVGWDAADVPKDIRLAILMTVAKFDSNRGDCEEGGANASVYAMKNSSGSALPGTAAALLNPYKLARVTFV